MVRRSLGTSPSGAGPSGGGSADLTPYYETISLGTTPAGVCEGPPTPVDVQNNVTVAGQQRVGRDAAAYTEAGD